MSSLIGLGESTAADRAAADMRGGGVSPSFCGGTLLAYLHAKPPLKGEVPALGGRRGSVLPTPQGRGGSVSRRDHNQAYRRRATLHGRTSPKKHPSLFPATLRERGSGGEALLLEKRPLPQRFPQNVFSRGSAREGPFLQKRPLPRNLSTLPTCKTLGACLHGGGANGIMRARW